MAPETSGTLLPLPLKLNGAQVSDIAISPDFVNDHTILVAADDQRLYRSSDAGASWSSQLLGQIQDLEFSPLKTSINTPGAALAVGRAAPNKLLMLIGMDGELWSVRE